MEIEVGRALKFPVCSVGVQQTATKGGGKGKRGIIESDMNEINSSRQRENDDDPLDKKLGGIITLSLDAFWMLGQE